MSKIHVKTFICQKEGELFTCQDRLAMNVQSGRFAVADGVSNSYHPEITAEWLCELFTKENYRIDEWPLVFTSSIFNHIGKLWDTEVKGYEATLSERQLKRAIYQREDLPAGSSTLVGISVDIATDNIHYHILGDSSLFVIQENQPAKCLCTSRRELRDNREYVIYDSHPDCIIATERMQGEWLSGTIPMSKGYIALMTDGASEWLQDASWDSPLAIEQLWKLEDHDSMLRFVDDCRQQGKMDDDIAIIILKIDDDWNEGYEVIFDDKLSEIPGMNVWKIRTDIYQPITSKEETKDEPTEDAQPPEKEQLSSTEDSTVPQINISSTEAEAVADAVKSEIILKEDNSDSSDSQNKEGENETDTHVESSNKNSFRFNIIKLIKKWFGPTKTK